MDNDKISKIINKLQEHDKKLNVLVVKDEFKKFATNTTNILEDIATRVKRIDEDRIFTSQWVRRIEEKVDQHETILQKIKSELKIS